MNYKNKVLLAIIIIKVSTFIWFLSQGGLNVISGVWGSYQTEVLIEYFQPMESFISTGIYDPDLRMPGYGIVYLLPRLLTNQMNACNILLIIQLVISIISVYLLAEIAFRIFKSKIAFILTALVYALNFCVSDYDTILSADSLAASFSIISFYFFIVYWERRKKKDLIFAALMICWAIFTRPVMGILWGVMGMFLLLYALKKRTIKNLLAIVIFALPFLVTDSLWIARNYVKHRTISPFDSLLLYSYDQNNTRSYSYYGFIGSFVKSWGGNSVLWDPNSEVRWLGIENIVVDGSDAYSQLGEYKKDLPDYIYTSRFNKDSLLVLKEKFKLIYAHNLPPEQELDYCEFVNQRLFAYTQSIKKEKPFIYYVYGPLKIIKTFLLNHGTQTLIPVAFSEMNLFQKAIKLSAAIINLFIIFGGIVGIILSLITKDIFRGERKFILLSIPIFTCIMYLFFIGFIFKFPEIRFMVPLYSFLLLCAMYIFVLLEQYLKRFFKQKHVPVNKPE